MGWGGDKQNYIAKFIIRYFFYFLGKYFCNYSIFHFLHTLWLVTRRLQLGAPHGSLLVCVLGRLRGGIQNREVIYRYPTVGRCTQCFDNHVP